MSAGAWRLPFWAPFRGTVHCAKVVSEDKVPADVVRMGSTVTFRSDAGTDGEQHELTETLVYPVDEDSDARKLSVMTPVGAALIVSLVSWAASSVIGSKGEVEMFRPKR